MDFSRFKEIIIKNKRYNESVNESLKIFYNKVQWNNDGDITKVIKEIGRKLDVLIFEVPMHDSDFGAVFLDTGDNKYLLLNSNQPKSKMYFSFCHDLYHILHGTPEYINEKREVHFNKDYYSTNDNENKANLFAANLLMPEKEFISLYNLYKNDYATSIEAIIVKLMYYFNAPFIAVLIRLYELNILNKLEDVKNILEYKNNEIEDVFDSLFLDKDILKPTLKDQMEYVFSILEKEGHDLIEKQLLTEYNYKRIIDNIKKLYDKIRLKD